MHFELIVIIGLLVYISYMLWSIREAISVVAIKALVGNSSKEK